MNIFRTFNCDQSIISELLLTLEKEKIASREPNSNLWSRTPHHLGLQLTRFSFCCNNYINFFLEQISQNLKVVGGPTVAIVTALYVEKLAIDAVIQDRQTYVRYKTAG